MQRGFVPIWLVLGLVLVAAIAGLFYLIINQCPEGSVHTGEGCVGTGGIISSPAPLVSTSSGTGNLNEVVDENGDIWRTYYDNNFKYKISYPENTAIETSYKTSPGELLSDGSLVLDRGGLSKLGFIFNFQGGWCEGGGCKESELTTNAGVIVRKYESSTTTYYSIKPETAVLDNVFITSGPEDMVLTEQIIKTMEFE